jgi:tetratricopeptide (TPR) repeat protein
LRAAAALVAVVMIAGCGSPPPPAYTHEKALAARAQRQGDPLLAARHYEQAAHEARTERDADEARYLAGESYARGGNADRARVLFEELARKPGERQERAAFALPELRLRAGDEERGQAELAAAIRRYPSSGVARTALAKHLAYLREHDGSSAVLAYLEAERRTLGSSELSETLDYNWARELDETGQTSRARDAYLACATRFPYPGGAYWDDALYRAAQKELELGNPQAALTHLTRLLAEQEDAAINGSYQRSRYAEGQLLVAEIYRDRLHDPLRARRELRKLWTKHPTSRLVDDALFQEALLARDARDASGTCEPLRILSTQLPGSRYAACVHLLCEALPARPHEDCHDYVRRAAGLP